MASPANPPRENRVDFGRALGFVFEDPDWLKKVLLGGLFALLGFLIIGSLLVGGYWLRLVRRVARGEARPLPEWTDWGGILMDGLMVLGVYIVHVLALVLPLGAVGCLLGVVAAALGGNKQTSDAAGLLAGVGILGVYALVMVLAVALALYLPAVLTRLAVLGRFNVAFEVRENVGLIRRNLGDYALALVIFLVANFISQFGVILFCVGIFPASFWAYCVLGYPLGLIARRDAVLGPAALRA
jgi:Protein of unknown function (DUF4013)